MKHQKGQAMVLSVMLLSVTLMVALFSFNASQLNLKSTKLQHTADNVAYSLGSIAARDLNFKAYTNRAMVANQVAVAQMVGLSSWFNMLDKSTENLATITRWIPYVGQVTSAIETVMANVNRVAQQAFSLMVLAENGVLWALSSSQQIIHYAGLISTFSAAQEITKQNDPKAEASMMQNFLLLGDVKDIWVNFQQRYKRSTRKSQYKEFIDVTNRSRDRFTQRRSYKWGMFSINLGLFKFTTRKAGGSDLISNGRNRAETWTAMDTVSTHFARWRCKWSGCGWKRWEVPMGWGSSRSDSRANIKRIGSRKYWGGSRGTNRRGSNLAARQQTTVGNYSGVQPFFGLRNSVKNVDSSLLGNISVVVSKNRSDMRTTSSISAGHDATNPAKNEKFAGNQMTALASSQVFYSRPKELWKRSDGKGEYGNLYNPFWQPRLSKSTRSERTAVLAFVRAL